MKEHTIYFISINVDGEERVWELTPSALVNEFHGKCDLPSLDDTILSCRFADTTLYFETFSDLMYAFTGEG